MWRARGRNFYGAKQLEAARALLGEAEANNVKAQNDLGRYKQLVDKQEISQSNTIRRWPRQPEPGVAAAQASVSRAMSGPSPSQTEPGGSQFAVGKTAPQQISVMRSRAAVRAGPGRPEKS